MSNISKLSFLVLVVFITQSCKKKCENETKIRFHNQTGVNFSEIGFKDSTYVFDFRDGTNTSYYTIIPNNFVWNYIQLKGPPSFSIKTRYTNEQLKSLGLGNYTFHFTDVDTVHVFNDTTLWFHITKDK